MKQNSHKNEVVVGAGLNRDMIKLRYSSFKNEIHISQHPWNTTALNILKLDPQNILALIEGLNVLSNHPDIEYAINEFKNQGREIEVKETG